MKEQDAWERRRVCVFHGCVVWGRVVEVLGRGGSLDNSAPACEIGQHGPRPLLLLHLGELDGAASQPATICCHARTALACPLQ